MVLYVFGVRSAAYVKVGYTASCPWSRVRDGFWRNVHPKGCCNRLGWDSLELLGLFPGELADEALLQARIPPECGELWPREGLPELRRALVELAVARHNCNEDEAELPLPPRPAVPLQGAWRGALRVLRRLSAAVLCVRSALQALDRPPDAQARELPRFGPAHSGLLFVRRQGDPAPPEAAPG